MARPEAPGPAAGAGGEAGDSADGRDAEDGREGRDAGAAGDGARSRHPEPDRTHGPGAPLRRRQRLLVGLVALLAVAAVGAATLAAVFAGRLQGERRDRGEVKRVAAAMVTALTTYDYARLDDSRRQVLELATGRFRDEYDRGAAPLRQVLAQTQARSTGRVTKVYLGQIADGGAEALVSADQVVTGVGGSRPVTGELLSLTLVHAGGRWRVDGLALEAGGSGGGGAAPGTPPPAPGTTSTTAP